MAALNERFAEAMSEVDEVKERERSLYEESIVRLLSNLDKRDYYSSQAGSRR